MIHLFLYFIGVWDKISIKIRLPKSKKYKNKVDPIYELKESFSLVYIYKWSLRYEQHVSWLAFFLLILPYPIKLYKFGYHVEGDFSISWKELINLDDDLKTIYESILEKTNLENKIKEEKRKNIKNKFDQLNQIFKENYE